MRLKRVPLRLLAWFTTEHWLIGASLTRVSLGLLALYYYGLHLSVRHTLYGPDGVWPLSQYLLDASPFSLFRYVPPSAFEALYAAAIAVAVLLTLGVFPRLMTVLHWLFVWSFQDRNPLLGDGGDNFVRIILLFLVLVNTGAYLTVMAPRPRRLVETKAIVHNVGVLLILAQLAYLYVSTGFYKVMGEVWQNGTALYYILRVEEFTWPALARYITHNPWLVVGGTYGTVLFEVFFLPALLNRYTRYLVIGAGVLFHVNIALIMGLVTFAWSMLAVYPLLLTDDEYRGVVRRWRLEVFYDGWCPSCVRSIDLLRSLGTGLVRYRSFRTVPEIDQDRAARRILSRRSDGAIREGMDVLIQIAGRAPCLWPAVPPLVVGRVLFGQRLYDAMARRRLVMVPGGCDEHCPAGQASGRP